MSACRDVSLRYIRCMTGRRMEACEVEGTFVREREHWTCRVTNMDLLVEGKL